MGKNKNQREAQRTGRAIQEEGRKKNTEWIEAIATKRRLSGRGEGVKSGRPSLEYDKGGPPCSRE